jgi:hypothetical protein
MEKTTENSENNGKPAAAAMDKGRSLIEKQRRMISRRLRFVKRAAHVVAKPFLKESAKFLEPVTTSIAKAAAPSPAAPTTPNNIPTTITAKGPAGLLQKLGMFFLKISTSTLASSTKVFLSPTLVFLRGLGLKRDETVGSDSGDFVPRAGAEGIKGTDKAGGAKAADKAGGAKAADKAGGAKAADKAEEDSAQSEDAKKIAAGKFTALTFEVPNGTGVAAATLPVTASHEVVKTVVVEKEKIVEVIVKENSGLVPVVAKEYSGPSPSGVVNQQSGLSPSGVVNEQSGLSQNDWKKSLGSVTANGLDATSTAIAVRTNNEVVNLPEVSGLLSPTAIAVLRQRMQEMASEQERMLTESYRQELMMLGSSRIKDPNNNALAGGDAVYVKLAEADGSIADPQVAMQAAFSAMRTSGSRSKDEEDSYQAMSKKLAEEKAEQMRMANLQGLLDAKSQLIEQHKKGEIDEAAYHAALVQLNRSYNATVPYKNMQVDENHSW